MNTLRPNKIAQILFVLLGLILIGVTLLQKMQIISVSMSETLYILIWIATALYFFYLGIMAVFTNTMPHDGAVLIFNSRQLKGFRARVVGVSFVLSSMLLSVTVFDSYYLEAEREKLDSAIEAELRRNS